MVSRVLGGSVDIFCCFLLLDVLSNSFVYEIDSLCHLFYYVTLQSSLTVMTFDIVFHRESLLVDSANRNNQDLLLMVLTGAYGSYTQEDVNNALIRAANNGNTDCVKLLLDWNADSDVEDMDGDTPLMLAASNNHVAVAQVRIHCLSLVSIN